MNAQWGIGVSVEIDLEVNVPAEHGGQAIDEANGVFAALAAECRQAAERHGVRVLGLRIARETGPARDVETHL